MRKRTAALYAGMGILISILTFMLMPAYSQEEIVALGDSAFGDRERPAAVFAHDEHNEKAEIEECNVCHHVYEGGNKVENDSNEGTNCSECHHVEGGDTTRPLMKAYHDLCKSCHRENKAGPVTCGECHRK